jgi:hypothetical protein
MSANLIERRVMAEKNRTFRPWPENQERLEFAEKLDLNVSEVINEVLQQNLKRHLESKTKKLREQLSVPVP